MSTISLRLPESLHNQLREMAKAEDVSINQFITTAVAEKLSALMTVDYLKERAARGDRAAFERAMGKVPDAGDDPRPIRGRYDLAELVREIPADYKPREFDWSSDEDEPE